MVFMFMALLLMFIIAEGLLEIHHHQQTAITYTMRRESNEKTCASRGLRLEYKSSLARE